MPNRWIGFSMWKYLCKIKKSFMTKLTSLFITRFPHILNLWTCVGISLSQNRCCHTACLLHIVPRGRATCSSLWLHEQIAITGNWDCGRARRHFSKCWIGIDSRGSSEWETWGPGVHTRWEKKTKTSMLKRFFLPMMPQTGLSVLVKSTSGDEFSPGLEHTDMALKRIHEAQASRWTRQRNYERLYRRWYLHTAQQMLHWICLWAVGFCRNEGERVCYLHLCACTQKSLCVISSFRSSSSVSACPPPLLSLISTIWWL